MTDNIQDLHVTGGESRVDRDRGRDVHRGHDRELTAPVAGRGI